MEPSEPFDFSDCTPERAARIPAPFSEMRVIAVLALGSVLLLWDAPWVELKIGNEVFATQTGYEVALGRVSVTGLEGYKQGGASRTAGLPLFFTPEYATGMGLEIGPFDTSIGVPRGVLSAIFAVLILAGLSIALFVRPAQLAVASAAACSILASGVLINQLAFGFPFEPEWTTMSVSRDYMHPVGTLSVSCTPWSLATLAATFVLPVVVVAEWQLRQHEDKARLLLRARRRWLQPDETDSTH
jgi:hypothetical protein